MTYYLATTDAFRILIQFSYNLPLYLNKQARLNGHDVAVKVRHPNVEEQIGIDFIIMKAVASAIESIPGLEWLKLSETMSQFSATIASQTDLSVEGKHLFLFNHHFKHWRSASFPKPIILTPSVLVESFEFGDSVDKYARTLKCKSKPSKVSRQSKSVISAEKLEFISESIRQLIIDRVKESFEGVYSGSMPPNALTPRYVCRNLNGPIMGLTWIASKEIEKIQSLRLDN